VPEEVCAESLDKRSGVIGGRARGDFGVNSGGEGFPAVVLKDCDNLGGLCMLVKVKVTR